MDQFWRLHLGGSPSQRDLKQGTLTGDSRYLSLLHPPLLCLTTSTFFSIVFCAITFLVTFILRARVVSQPLRTFYLTSAILPLLSFLLNAQWRKSHLIWTTWSFPLRRGKSRVDFISFVQDCSAVTTASTSAYLLICVFVYSYLPPFIHSLIH